jgi:hypothetical protein
MTVPDVHVQRHVVTCRVLGQGPAGESELRTAVDRLGSELEDAMGAVGLDGYWVVRRLDAHAQVGASWSSAQMGVSLARGIAARVAELTRRGNNPETALWFPDRAAFVSRFLLDLAEGRADGRWEYAQFAHLLGRAVGGVVLAEAEPETVADALLMLSPVEVEVVAVALDGDAILATLATHGPVDVTPLLAAVRRLATAGRPDLPRGAALVLATTVARDTGLSLGAVASAAREVADALALMRGAGPLASVLLEAIRDGRWRDVAALAAADEFLPLVRWSASDRAAFTEVVAGPGCIALEAERVHTPFGGGLLLVPLLDDLWDWVEASCGWPEGAVGVVRLLCVAAALGRGGGAVAADPVLRAALGVPDDLDVFAWLDGVTDAQVTSFEAAARLADGGEVTLAVADAPASRVVSRTAHGLLDDLGRRLPGMASASPEYLRRNVLDVDAWVGFGEREVVAELGHAPLSVLLAMTGLDRGTFVVGEVRWTLTTRP